MLVLVLGQNHVLEKLVEIISLNGMLFKCYSRPLVNKHLQSFAESSLCQFELGNRHIRPPVLA